MPDYSKPPVRSTCFEPDIRLLSGARKVEMQAEMSENARRLFKDGLRRYFPHLNEEELHKFYLERMALCHNQNY
jgi:hypothetical protein